MPGQQHTAMDTAPEMFCTEVIGFLLDQHPAATDVHPACSEMGNPSVSQSLPALPARHQVCADHGDLLATDRVKPQEPFDILGASVLPLRCSQ